MNKFENKVALISGGSRGVGYAIANRLVDAGAKVVISARGAKRLEDSAARLRQKGGKVVAVTGDIGKWEDAKRMVNAAIDEFGRLDILVNNAGVSMRGDFADLSGEVCSRVIATNLTGSVNLSRIAMEHLIEARGSLVFISSIAGLFGLPGASVYCASKMALTGLCESLRLELIPKGVHVGVVYLGFTEHDPEKRILSASGELILPDRPAHHSQDKAGKLVVDLITKRKRQVVMTPIGSLGWFAHRLSPLLVEKVVLWAKESQIGLFKSFR
ncbi:MAG: SDR family oxidoreductase [Deltaproteobacteria bacterium]|nr:SDR family oxidoreductase [Deltaproteobacteria bacterium]